MGVDNLTLVGTELRLTMPLEYSSGLHRRSQTKRPVVRIHADNVMANSSQAFPLPRYLSNLLDSDFES
jgi:hypothetical protein